MEVIRKTSGAGWVCELLVSPDRMKAEVRLQRDKPDAICSPDQILAFLTRAGLVVAPADPAGLMTLARQIAASRTNTAMAAATGDRPRPAVDSIEWLIPMGLGQFVTEANDTVDLHEVTRFINVRKDQIICNIVAGEATTGTDVFGTPLPPAAIKVIAPAPLKLGPRVAFGKDPRTVVATEPGCVRYVDGVLSVEQVFEVKGDLNFKIGNVDFKGKVVIRGSVLDGFKIKATDDVLVDGVMGNASIETTGAIVIKGGVNGLHKGRLQAAGDVVARYLHQVSVSAGGNVTAEIECHDSLVSAGGDVKIVRGGIIGGQVEAGGNISAAFVGSERCVRTVVSAGHNADRAVATKRMREQAELAWQKVFVIEKALGPGMDKPEALQGVPLGRRANIEKQMAALAKAREAAGKQQDLLAASVAGTTASGATVRVQKRLFPNVLVLIDSVCLREVRSEIDGPATLVANPERAAVEVAKVAKI